MLTQRGDVAFPAAANSFKDAVTSGNHLYVVTGVADMRDYNLSTLALNYIAPLNVSLTGTGITMVNTATACISYATATVDFVNVNTGQRTTITSGTAGTTNSNYGQQIAGNINTGFAMATKTSGVTFINSLTQAATALNPSSVFTGQNSTVITVKPTTNTWLVGSSKGQVYEINAQGALVQTLNLPITSTSTTATTQVVGISYASPNMACTTDRGELFIYNWTTQTLVYRALLGGWDGSAGALLCPAASGTCLIGRGLSTSINEIGELYFETCDPTIGQVFWNESNANSRAIGFEPSLNIAWSIQNASNFMQIRTYNMSPTAKVNVDTRFQDPPGTDVAARIIRLRDDGIGILSIENDTNIPAAVTNISATDGKNYIEIGLEGGTQFDIREFTA